MRRALAFLAMFAGLAGLIGWVVGGWLDDRLRAASRSIGRLPR